MIQEFFLHIYNPNDSDRAKDQIYGPFDSYSRAQDRKDGLYFEMNDDDYFTLAYCIHTRES